VTGTLIDATAGSGVLSGATVTVVGHESLTATTDSTGKFTIQVPLGEQTLHFTYGSRFIPDQAITVSSTDAVTITAPIVAFTSLSAGQYRFVLTWGENPRDLDSYLYVPINNTYEEVYYGDETMSDSSANLDYDYQYGYGPETVSILTPLTGTYYYSVNHYAGSGTIGTSRAKVKIYKGNTLVDTIDVSTVAGASTETEAWWRVFSFNAQTGVVTKINTFNSTGR
jgi:uncharacterized protein YfaP (DUF2135 family)